MKQVTKKSKLNLWRNVINVKRRTRAKNEFGTEKSATGRSWCVGHLLGGMGREERIRQQNGIRGKSKKMEHNCDVEVRTK